MKKYLALLIMSFIMLTSMSNCKKDDGSLLGPTQKVSVKINGKKYEVKAVKPFFVRNPSFFCLVVLWNHPGKDSVSFEFNSSLWYIEENPDKNVVEYDLKISTENEFEIGEWYPIKSGYARWTSKGDKYNVVDGMIRLSEIEGHGKTIPPYACYRYRGEFWFDAINRNNPEDVMTARNGEFSLLAKIRDDRVDINDKNDSQP